MKQLLALFAIPLFTFAGSAHALAQNATSVKYFDENGAVVGQFIRLCSALTYQGGNTHTAYSITEETACGKNPTPDYIVPNSIITNYVLPGFLPITTACAAAQCEPKGVREPRRLTTFGWTWTSP